MITSNGGGDTAELVLPEGQAVVTQVTAVGAPGVTITYSITGGADASRFTINPVTGALSFVAAPDFEQPADSNGDNVYQVIVSASDGSLNDTQTLSVRVADRSVAPLLIAPSGFEGGIGGSTTVFLTTGFQDISIIDAPGRITLSGPPGGDDIIRFVGAASAYTITRVGSRVDIADSDTRVSIPVSSTGINVVFADGPRTLVIVGGQLQIGNQLVGATAAITAPAETDALPDLANPAVRGRLIVAEGSPVIIDGNIDVFGTSFDDETFTVAGGNVAIRGGFTGGDDAIGFDGSASSFTAARSGSTVFIEGPGTRVSIPVSPGGTKLIFTDGERLLKIDTATGKILIGDREVGLQPAPFIDVSNSAPTVANAIADQSVAEDTAWSFVVPATAFSDVDGNTLSYSASLANGSALPSWLSFNPGTRTFGGTPPLNFNGSLDLRVTASDGSLSAADTFRLSVTPVNDAPVLANAISDQSVAEDTAWSYVVPATAFSDVDTATLSYSASLADGSALPAWLSFSASTRTFSGTPPLNFNGSLDLRVTVSDGSLSAADTFRLSVTPVNDAPVLANAISDQSVAEDTAWSFVVPATAFSDVDGNTLSYSASLANGSALPAWLSFNAGTRTFSGTPPLNFNGSLDLRVTASDGSLSAADTFRLSVSSVNKGPTLANAIADQSVAEDTAVSFTFPANAFSDADGDTLSYSASLADGSALPAWLTFNPDTRTFSGTPPLNFNGSLDLRVTASDGSLSAADTFRLSVTPVNDAPVAVADVAAATEDGAVVTSSVRTNDSDTDTTDVLSYTLVAPVAGLMLNANGTYSFDPSNAAYNSLAAGQTQSVVANINVSDGNGGTATSTLTITVTGTNDAPVVANAIPDRTVAEDTAWLYAVPANTFTDADGNTLTYTASLASGAALPSWLSFNASTRTFSGTPPLNFNGNIDLRVAASDGSLSASDSFRLTVAAVNDAPVVANAIADQSVNEDTAWSFVVPANAFSDVDSDTLTYSASLADGSALPSWLTFNASTRTFSGTPPVNFNGNIDLRVNTSDGSASVNDDFRLAVTPVNDIPTGALEINVDAIVASLVSQGEVSSSQRINQILSLDDRTWLALSESGTFSKYLLDGSLEKSFFFQINGLQQGIQASLSVENNIFLVYRKDPQLQGNIEDVFGRIFSADGLEIKQEFLVNTTTFGRQDGGSVSSLKDAGWIVVWGSDDGFGSGIFGQRFDSDGNRIGTEFRVNASISGEQVTPRVLGSLDGGWVVVWTAGGEIFSRQYQASGDPISDDVRVNTTTIGEQNEPDIVALADGGWLVVWNSNGQDGSVSGVYAQRFSSAGLPVSTEFRVNEFTRDAQFYNSASALQDGGWIITWQSLGQDSSGFGIYGQRYDSRGQAAGPEFRVNSSLAGDQVGSKISGLSDGGFIVSWLSNNTLNGGELEYFFQRFNRDGDRGYDNFTIQTFNAANFEIVTGNTLTIDTSALLDADGLGDISWSWQRSRDGLTWADIPSEGSLSYTVSVQDEGNTLRAVGRYVDGGGTTEVVISSATAFVKEPPSPQHPPVVANAIADQSVNEDTAWSFVVPANAFSDVDSDTLTYSASLADGSALPSWLSFNASTRTFSGTPSLNFNGNIDVRVIASDGSSTVSDTFRLTVSAVNDAPVVANAIADQFITPFTALSFVVPANAFSDVDGDTLTYSASLADGSALPSWLSFNASTRTFSGVPPQQFNLNGDIDVEVTAFDGMLSASDQFNIKSGSLSGYNVIVGTSSSDTLRGSNGDDLLIGLDGDDVLLGGTGDFSGNDVVIGGLGIDRINGGPGIDRYIYYSLEEIDLDVISDGLLDFIIDFSLIDADPEVEGRQEFTISDSRIIGNSAITGRQDPIFANLFTGKNGEIVALIDNIGGGWLHNVYIDSDGDKLWDFRFQITGQSPWLFIDSNSFSL